MTPAVIAPKKAWTADGLDLGSIETVPIAFKLSNASSFKVFAPEDLILYDKKNHHQHGSQFSIRFIIHDSE